MEKPKQYDYVRAAGFPRGAGVEEIEDGKYVLHCDYARLEGLAREMAERIVKMDVWQDFAEPGAVHCHVCGGKGETRTTINHTEVCVVAKSEAFLAGGI